MVECRCRNVDENTIRNVNAGMSTCLYFCSAYSSHNLLNSIQVKPTNNYTMTSTNQYSTKVELLYAECSTTGTLIQHEHITITDHDVVELKDDADHNSNNELTTFQPSVFPSSPAYSHPSTDMMDDEDDNAGKHKEQEHIQDIFTKNFHSSTKHLYSPTYTPLDNDENEEHSNQENDKEANQHNTEELQPLPKRSRDVPSYSPQQNLFCCLHA